MMPARVRSKIWAWKRNMSSQPIFEDVSVRVFPVFWILSSSTYFLRFRFVFNAYCGGVTKAANIITFWCWLALLGVELGIFSFDLGEESTILLEEIKKPSKAATKELTKALTALASSCSSSTASKEPDSDMRTAIVAQKRAKIAQSEAATSALGEEAKKTREEASLLRQQK